ncbi:hypothetical protein [Gimesia fumaroli]|uniref:Uncharacterized protein n=1 Tax=Gimesia fumaroli TaxID=2527976 RepID=A0A518IES3_9PLAN|nr:hypothetical protein [Gimesia fumaroli]QDV51585.1 hypothetical protein Enr17x_36410 [Gimesia fumaroli]
MSKTGIIFSQWIRKLTFVFIALAIGFFLARSSWPHQSTTQRLDELHVSIQESSMSSKDKLLLLHLIRKRASWESGLINTYLQKGFVKRVIWDTQFQTSAGETRHVFLLTPYQAPGYKKLPITTLCVVTNKNYELLSWDTILTSASGIRNAKLSKDGTNILEVTGACVWFYGLGVHHFALNSDQIVRINDVKYRPYEKSENKDQFIVPYISQSEYASLNLNFPPIDSWNKRRRVKVFEWQD